MKKQTIEWQKIFTFACLTKKLYPEAKEAPVTQCYIGLVYKLIQSDMCTCV